jgi:hypothetical protein
LSFCSVWGLESGFSRGRVIRYNRDSWNERASYNGSIEASQASDVGSIPIARSNNPLVTGLRQPNQLLLQIQRRSADAGPLEVEIYVDVVGNLDERNTFVHTVVFAVEDHTSVNHA